MRKKQIDIIDNICSAFMGINFIRQNKTVGFIPTVLFLRKGEFGEEQIGLFVCIAGITLRFIFYSEFVNNFSE